MHIHFEIFEKKPFIKACQRFFKDLGLPLMRSCEKHECHGMSDLFKIVDQPQIQCFALAYQHPLNHADLLGFSKNIELGDWHAKTENNQSKQNIFLIKDPIHLHLLSFQREILLAQTVAHLQIVPKIPYRSNLNQSNPQNGWLIFFEAVKRKFKQDLRHKQPPQSPPQINIHADLMHDLLKKELITWFNSVLSTKEISQSPYLYLDQMIESIFLEALIQNQSQIDLSLHVLVNKLRENGALHFDPFEALGIAHQKILSKFFTFHQHIQQSNQVIHDLISIIHQYPFFNPFNLIVSPSSSTEMTLETKIEWIGIHPRFLGEIYEELMDLPCFQSASKKQSGRFYTKLTVAKMMSQLAFEDLSKSMSSHAMQSFKMIDPCAGGGQMLLSALEAYLQLATRLKQKIDFIEFAQILQSNIYFADIDPLSLKITALSLCFAMPLEKMPMIQWKMAQIDGLSNNYFEQMSHLFQMTNQMTTPVFDLLITNPPYGQSSNLSNLHHELPIDKKDDYAIFLYRWLSQNTLLKSGAKVIFLCSDTFMSIVSHERLRKHLLQFQIHRLIKLSVKAFKATVHTCILDLSFQSHPPKHCLKLLDLTRFHVFPSSLKKFDQIKNYHHQSIAIDTYPQSDVLKHPKHVFFSCSREALSYLISPQAHCKPLRTLAQIKVGLQTGDNQKYLFQSPAKSATYPLLTDDLKAYVCTAKDLKILQTDQVFRQKIIKQGFSLDPKSDRYLDGKWIVPYDKGEDSDIHQGWLPNYHVPTHYWLKWDESSVQSLSQNQLAKSSRARVNGKYLNTHKLSYLRNPDFYFKPGITYSSVGTYAPSFRIGSASIFGHMGPTIFCESIEMMSLLGLLCSKWMKFLLKNLINHTHATEISNLGELPVIEEPRIATLVLSIINQQKTDPTYPYMQFEQKLIDALVYQIYQVPPSLQQEVEAWYQRRYPNL